MKISEIALPKQIYRDIKYMHPYSFYHDPMDEMLKEKGWKMIGHGAFSNVYSKPNKNYVIKVNMEVDTGYQRFVDFCKKNRNRYLPRIMDDKFFKSRGKIYHIYLIEKLDKFSDVSLKRAIGDLGEDMEWNSIKTVLRDHSKDIKKLKKYPGLLDLIITLYKFRGSKDLDLNTENIMMRKNGTPVITDPWA
jgi:hypothetical protein